MEPQAQSCGRRAEGGGPPVLGEHEDVSLGTRTAWISARCAGGIPGEHHNVERGLAPAQCLPKRHVPGSSCVAREQDAVQHHRRTVPEKVSALPKLRVQSFRSRPGGTHGIMARADKASTPSHSATAPENRRRASDRVGREEASEIGRDRGGDRGARGVGEQIAERGISPGHDGVLEKLHGERQQRGNQHHPAP